jgi:hypothetical protein
MRNPLHIGPESTRKIAGRRLDKTLSVAPQPCEPDRTAGTGAGGSHVTGGSAYATNQQATQPPALAFHRACSVRRLHRRPRHAAHRRTRRNARAQRDGRWRCERRCDEVSVCALASRTGSKRRKPRRVGGRSTGCSAYAKTHRTEPTSSPPLDFILGMAPRTLLFSPVWLMWQSAQPHSPGGLDAPFASALGRPHRRPRCAAHRRTRRHALAHRNGRWR